MNNSVDFFSLADRLTAPAYVGVQTHLNLSGVARELVLSLQRTLPRSVMFSPEYEAVIASIRSQPVVPGYDAAKEWAETQVVVDWLWTTVLPIVTPAAKDAGFGVAWAEMLAERSVWAAKGASQLADLYYSLEASDAATYAAEVIQLTSKFKGSADIVEAMVSAVYAADSATYAATDYTPELTNGAFWLTLDVPALLSRVFAAEVK
jgi:hypothetical protein